VLWRSHGLYFNDGADMALGPHLFAFAAYRRGVYLTDLRGPERLVLRGRGLHPFEFTRRGELLVATDYAATRHDRILILARDGTRLRSYAYRRRNGYTFDGGSETLYFIGHDDGLRAASGARLRLVRKLRGVEGRIGFSRPELLIFIARHSVAIRRLDGTLVARASWPRSKIDVLDSGPSVSRDGRDFSFRLSDAHPGARAGTAVLYVFHRGEFRARAIYRHRLGPSGCAAGANIFWHGRFLLYSSADGQRAILDSRGGTVELTRLAAALPGRSPGERADTFWASDLSHK
jgi:hypothetical protein